ncbi:MAG: inorganic diphosphatase [Candidatus Nanohaloarchaeota archaeon QJJ-9]|nr:inorganic diphosphatase [Candidatus Nanohaloarchaeota archaeon QJJ-9]
MTDDHWKDLPTGPDVPEVVYAVIEIPKGSRNKYEYSKELGTYTLDRVLYSPQQYPGEYGFIPQTIYDDGDPMDIIVLMEEDTYPGCIIEARPIGLMKMVDGGEQDDKILAVPKEDPRYEDMKNIDDVAAHTKKEIAEFFKTYKNLEEGKHVEVNGWEDRKSGIEAVKHSVKLFKEKFKD